MAEDFTSALTGAVFSDYNGNGVRDAGEPAMAGVRVELERLEPTLLHTFLNPTPGKHDNFGYPPVAIGENILIGAWGDDSAASNAGAVYMFDGNTGALIRTFLNPEPNINDRFGMYVAACGDDVLVSAYLDDSSGADRGAAYLLDGETGQLLRKFVTPNMALGTQIRQVAALGDSILIGAYQDNHERSDTGAVYLFNGKTGRLMHTFANPRPAFGDGFAFSMAAVGNNVLVSAPLDDTSGYNTGAAYLFDGSTGKLLHTFLNPTPERNDQFGRAVAAVGNDVLIGAWGDNTGGGSAGAAYLFDGNTGELLHTFLNPTPRTGDGFAEFVSSVGDDVLIGAWGDDAGATNAGVAYLFDGDSGELLETFYNPTPEPYDQFGIAVGAFGGQVLVAANGDDTGALNSGAVYLFATKHLVGTAMTDEQGNYRFDQLEAGKYTLSQVVPDRYEETLPGNNAYTVTVDVGQEVSHLDFGNHGDALPPTIVELLRSAATVDLGDVIYLAGSFTDPDGGPHAITIDWGDGIEETITLAAGVERFDDLQHVYQTSGLQSATVTISDNEGGKAVEQFDVWVNPWHDVVDLGELLHPIEMPKLDLRGGELWFRVEATRDDVVVFRPKAEGITVQLFDTEANLLVTQTSGSNHDRIQYTLEAGRAYYFQLLGNDPKFNLHFGYVPSQADPPATKRSKPSKAAIDFLHEIGAFD